LAEEAAQQLPDILRTPATSPRPLADYQPLLFPETDPHEQPPQDPAPADEPTAEADGPPDRQQPDRQQPDNQQPGNQQPDTPADNEQPA
jgi:hypothetical protein